MSAAAAFSVVAAAVDPTSVAVLFATAAMDVSMMPSSVAVFASEPAAVAVLPSMVVGLFASGPAAMSVAPLSEAAEIGTVLSGGQTLLRLLLPVLLLLRALSWSRHFPSLPSLASPVPAVVSALAH